ncbi:hypothetical protein EVAR_72191_1 [Eumeta japonica]|uniref:Uncharacterized protein n=1 Tax=Eumeta variegata TaxID=151549 RepID=A0A4C1SR63_EUMVA|nr:hypothetical protein EVAR_72191_1 [Eumeta japonica]
MAKNYNINGNITLIESVTVIAREVPIGENPKEIRDEEVQLPAQVEQTKETIVTSVDCTKLIDEVLSATEKSLEHDVKTGELMAVKPSSSVYAGLPIDDSSNAWMEPMVFSDDEEDVEISTTNDDKPFSSPLVPFDSDKAFVDKNNKTEVGIEDTVQETSEKEYVEQNIQDTPKETAAELKEIICVDLPIDNDSNAPVIVIGKTGCIR